MNLPEALKKQREDFIKAVPPDTVTIFNEAVEELSHSGLLAQCLKESDPAPDFSLADAHNITYSLSDSLDNGPVILKFFRGDW